MATTHQHGGNRVLVLGATGGIGSEVAGALRARGWAVRAMHRRGPQAGARHDGIEWVHGDAMQPADVLAAAQGCKAIVHAVNPPGYRRWNELVLPMIDNTIAAARTVGATIVLPGTVYNYGPDAFPVLREDAPQRPLTRKGAIRVELERRLQHATEHGGCQVIIVRAGDFFGPRVGSNWFSQGLVKPGRAVRTAQRLGTPSVGHQWSYLPDVACAMAQLLERRAQLPAFAAFHMAGHWDADGMQMLGAIERAVVRSGAAAPRVRDFPWGLVRVGAPVVPLFRELLEMRYLWQQPVRMDNSALLAVLGEEPHTPLDVAVQATLEGLGCLPARPSTGAPLPVTPPESRQSPARLRA